jgi:PAS domain S-box-containing protein
MNPSDLQALAQDVLLGHLDHGDARHALQQLVLKLGSELQAPCAIVAQTDDASVRWTVGELPPPGQAQRLPLQRLQARQGWLVLPAGVEPAQVEPLLATAAALLLHDSEQAAGARNGHAALLHAALAGADTFVWEWDIDSDWLSDVDEGLARLGYVSQAAGHTQESWNALIHPEDRDANHDAYLRHERGEVETYEHAYRVLAADGHWRWMEERGRIVERHPDGRPRRMLGTQTDITERRALEQAASDALQRLEKIARHAPGVLFQYEMAPNGRQRFRYVSEAIRELSGLRPHDATNDSSAAWEAIVPDDRPGVFSSLRESALALGEWRHEFRMIANDGEPRWLLGSATPQRESDGTIVWNGTVTDISERHELEQARQDAAVAALASRTKTEFLSRMSHELRTPLNAVLGFTQLMEIDVAEPPSDNQKRRLKLIREAGAHLLQMIGELLDLTRIESGSLALQLGAVGLRSAAEDALAMLRDSAAQAQLTLTLLPGGADATARADPTRLRQVLLNLLSNAIKYNRPGGSVTLHVHPGGGTVVRFSVRDTGIGIAEADLPRLFEPFHRGPRAGGPVEGTGIGLSITQALVSLMDGRIDVHSTVGAGSTFTVTLPAA